MPSNQAAGQGIQMPSSCKAFIPLVLAIAALILGTAPTFQCETLQFTQVENDVGQLLLVGPWSYRTKYAKEWSDQSFAAQTCNNYGKNGLDFDYDKDAKTDTVYAFSIMTPVLGFFIILKSFFHITCAGGAWSKGGYACLGYSYLVTAIFQGLVLLINTSSLCYENPALQYLEANNADLADTLSDECEITTGYYLQAVAVGLWILAAGATFWVKDPHMTYEYPSQAQQVTYTQNVNGAIEETHVAIVKGNAVEKPME
jgi:hypothetical protein